MKFSGLTFLSTAFLPYDNSTATLQEQPILYRGSTHFNRIALTFDDCYLITMLRRLEDILEENPKVRISLFPVGEELISTQLKDPGIWKRFYKSGHEICYHSFDHTNPQVMSAEKIIADYDLWINTLQDVLGEEPLVRFARPPFGNPSPSFLQMCSARGLVPTMWSTGWGGETEKAIKYILPRIQFGDIVLLHTRREDMYTTQLALPELEARDIRPVTMSRIYMDWLKEQNQSAGCYADSTALTRTCIE